MNNIYELHNDAQINLEEYEERLIEIFKEYLPAWSWEEWQAAGASDKEDIN